MKVLTFCNNKGGVAKTTSAISIGAALRRLNKNVLLIDFDGQANLSASLRVKDQGFTIYHRLTNSSAGKVMPIRITEAGQTWGVLDVVPSCSDLAALNVALANRNDKQFLLAAAVEDYNKYDVVIIDTPPALDLLTINALYAADYAIIPIIPAFLAVQGFMMITDIIPQIEKARGRKLPYKGLVTMFDKRKGVEVETLDYIKSELPVFETNIRNSVQLIETPTIGKDVFTYMNGRGRACEDYFAAACEVANWMKLIQRK